MAFLLSHSTGRERGIFPSTSKAGWGRGGIKTRGQNFTQGSSARRGSREVYMEKHFTTLALQSVKHSTQGRLRKESEKKPDRNN